MITKSILLILIIASTLFARQDLSDVFQCVFDDCEDEYVKCFKDTKCNEAFKVIYEHGQGNKDSATSDLVDETFYDSTVQATKIDAFTELFNCMDKKCNYRLLYKCSGKRYAYKQCTSDNPNAEQVTCKTKYSKEFSDKTTQCVESKNKDCSKDDDAKKNLCISENTWKCLQDSFTDDDSTENYIKQYLACEVSSSMALSFTFIAAILSLII